MPRFSIKVFPGVRMYVGGRRRRSSGDSGGCLALIAIFLAIALVYAGVLWGLSLVGHAVGFTPSWHQVTHRHDAWMDQHYPNAVGRYLLLFTFLVAMTALLIRWARSRPSMQASRNEVGNVAAQGEPQLRGASMAASHAVPDHEGRSAAVTEPNLTRDRTLIRMKTDRDLSQLDGLAEATLIALEGLVKQFGDRTSQLRHLLLLLHKPGQLSLTTLTFRKGEGREEILKSFDEYRPVACAFAAPGGNRQLRVFLHDAYGHESCSLVELDVSGSVHSLGAAQKEPSEAAICREGMERSATPWIAGYLRRNDL
jgi:hypothetical protein